MENLAFRRGRSPGLCWEKRLIGREPVPPGLEEGVARAQAGGGHRLRLANVELLRPDPSPPSPSGASSSPVLPGPWGFILPSWSSAPNLPACACPGPGP